MRTARALLTLLTVILVPNLAADEGMWLFNRPPKDLIKQRYGFEVTDAWLDHARKSAVRFNTGGSAAFVSPDGLIITNHHVGSDCISKLSTKEHDYIREGFLARKRADEPRCTDLEVNVLVSIEDMTSRVNGAVTAGMPAADAERARRGVMAAIEKESLDKTGLRSDVVTLYQGGEYHLYRYKKYTDVRLVFAPEESIAFFGGDPDNFEYPRYDLDVAFFRAYEDGKPASTRDFFKFSAAGVKEGDLVFIAGNPGSTQRMNTVAHLLFARDVALPSTLNALRRREVTIGTWAKRSAENARRANDDMRGIENSRKALTGQLQGLQDPALIEAKRIEEQRLRAAINSDPKLAANADAWTAIEQIMQRQRNNFFERAFIANAGAFNSQLFGWARTILRHAEETAKPNADRLREFRESNLESLRFGLLADTPVYADLETLKLADSLAQWLETTPNDPLVAQVLAGKSPQARAAELVAGTKLADPAVRKALVEGGKAAVGASNDPMIAVARLVDARARELRIEAEQTIQEPQRQAYAKIANSRFAVSGTSVYPDATFTLRLGFGTVKGYQGPEGPSFPAITTIGGAFEHAAAHDNEPPFELPASWAKAKSKLNLSTPFNFVSTTDIIGGNSGSPVFNKAGEYVGIVFDMNIPSLVYNFAYKEANARSVNVHSAGIAEALRNVYGANELLRELGIQASR